MTAFKHQFWLGQDPLVALWDQTIAKKSKLVTDRFLSICASQQRIWSGKEHKVDLQLSIQYN